MQPLEQLLLRAQVLYAYHHDPGHDYAHVLRVMETAKRLGLKLGADLEILLPAAILHDLVNLPKNHPERKMASTLSAQKSKRILGELDFSERAIEKVAQVILEHSYSQGVRPTTLESSILQDADRLDALGAIGVMRTVSTGSVMGASYYNVLDPWAKDRELDDLKYTVDHFYVKLLKLAENLNTEEARKEGRRRAAFMKNFLDQLKSEMPL